MTRDEAQRILRTIDILSSARGWPRSVALEELVYAAAAAERAACAKVCDDEAMRCEAAVERAEPDEVSAIRSTAWKINVCAAAIRARGEK